MANEITILEGSSFRFSLFLIFPIASPKQPDGTNNAVPTPATNPDATSALPSIADSVLTTAEKTALDGGTAAYRVIQFRKDPSLTNAQLLTLVRQKYAEELAKFNQWYAQTYLHAGQRVNA